jgi:hypothetical protein
MRSALLPIGLLLVVIGLGNWYTGLTQGAQHEELLATGKLPAPVASFDDFPELNAHTTATLLKPLQRGSDQHTLVSAKLDFYKVVQSGGHILVLLGLFCSAAGVVRTWYRQRRER